MPFKLSFITNSAWLAGRGFDKKLDQSHSLRPMSANPRHNSVGSLREDRISVEPGNRLYQNHQTCQPKQRGNFSLRNAISRLCKKLQSGSSKQHSSIMGQRDEGNTRCQEQPLTDTLHLSGQNRSNAVGHTPEEITQIQSPAEDILSNDSASPEQMLSASSRSSFRPDEWGRLNRSTGLNQAVNFSRLATIPEEKHHELEQSGLNIMQLRAYNAAENDFPTDKNLQCPQVVCIKLDAHGKISVDSEVSVNLQKILKDTIAAPLNTYNALQSNEDNSQHLLMDITGRLVSLQSYKTSFIGLTQSTLIHDGDQQDISKSTFKPITKDEHSVSDNSGVKINFTADNKASITIRNNGIMNSTICLPDKTAYTLLTGIYNHDIKLATGNSKTELLREHQGRLYFLNEENSRWEPINQDEEKKHSGLTKQPNGMIYAIYDNKTLKNLTNSKTSSAFKEKISAYCTSTTGETLILLTDEKSRGQSLKLLTSLDGNAGKYIDVKLSDAETDFHCLGLAIYKDQLLAIDSQGKIFMGKIPDAENAHLSMSPNNSICAAIAKYFGQNYRVESLHHEDDQLSAVVVDEDDQRHICSIDKDGVLQPQWNLSESLVIDFHGGLPQQNPLPQETVKLGRLGNLTIDNGKVSVLNKNSQRWETSFVKADSIKRGQDGHAYVLNDGIPSRLVIKLKSDNINGTNNKFFIRQIKNNLSLEAPFPGFDRNNRAIAIAPLDAERIVALSDKNKLQFHINQPTNRQSNKIIHTLSKNGIANYSPHTYVDRSEAQPANGEGCLLVDIAIDKKQTLYVLDKMGKLYSMPKAQWQKDKNKDDPQKWQAVKLPGALSRLTQLHNGEDGALLIADCFGYSALLLPNDEGDFWQVNHGNGPDPGEMTSPTRAEDRVRTRLKDATHSYQIGGLTLRRETNLMGMSGRDIDQINSRLRDRLRAHLFNPRLATPRPVKNAVYSIQHTWRGREGLDLVYQRQHELHEQLKTLLSHSGEDSQRPPLELRLSELNHSVIDKTLVKSIKDFSDSIMESALHHSTLLGQRIGALHLDRTAISNFKPSLRHSLTQAINPWTDSGNLVQELAILYGRFQLRSENSSHTLMQTLLNQGIVVHHQKKEVPLHRQRDPYDDLDLVKSRLILDGVAMQQLHQLTDRLEQMSADPQISPLALRELREDFRLLREQTYGGDVIRKATSQGFVSNKQLEACYDAIKSMTKAFSKEHHGLNMTTRTVLGAKNRQELCDQLLKTINQLESDENVGFGRNYGGMLTLSVIPGGEVTGVPGIRSNVDRSYNTSFARGDTGINVTFSRNGGGTGTLFGSMGWNLMSQLGYNQDTNITFGNHSLVPSARLNAVLNIALQRQMQNSISFSLSEAELAEFVTDLTSGNLKPLALLDKGVNHRVKNGTTLTFNIDVSSTASVGGSISTPTTSHDLKKDQFIVQASAIFQGMVNILSKSSEHSVTHGENQLSLSDSNNRVSFFNSAALGVGLTGGLGITTSAAQKLRIPLFGISNISLQATLENRTKHFLSIGLSKAEYVERYQLSNLIDQVGLNFDDAKTNKLIQELKDAEKPPAKPGNRQSKNERIEEIHTLKQQAVASITGGGNPKSSNKNNSALIPKENNEFEKKGEGEILNSTSINTGSDEKLNTFFMDDKQAVNILLEKLTEHLLGLTPISNGQYAVINSARQLKLQQKAAELSCQQLTSAEYTSSYTNLRKIDHSDMLHVLHNLFASELPPNNAERISRFMLEKPLLKQFIRELQTHEDTQATVKLEMKDNKKFEIQDKWLNHEAQPEDIFSLLKDSNNLRVKSITFTQTKTKSEGINLPLIFLGGSSSANVSITSNLGKINFLYGKNQDTPNAFSLEGEIAQASDDLSKAITNSQIQEKRSVI